MTIHVLWTRDRGWICNVYESGISLKGAADRTTPVKMTYELGRICPDIAPYDPEVINSRRSDIESALHEKYPGARIEFGAVPTNR